MKGETEKMNKRVGILEEEWQMEEDKAERKVTLEI
jgi:hypothetical protein